MAGRALASALTVALLASAGAWTERPAQAASGPMVVTTVDADGRPHIARLAPGEAMAADLPGRLVAVSPDRPVAAVGVTDPLRSQQWALNAVTFEDAWEYTDGAGVVVAVLDTGVTATHQDLRTQVLPGAHFLHDANGVASAGDGGTVDGHGHGTHVSGIVAASIDDLGIAGAAPGVKILPVKVLGDNGSGWLSDIASGIVWAADHGADVINLSLGVGMAGVDPAVEAAITYANAQGVVVVAAAGNTGCTVGVGACSAFYPASSASVVAVGAVETATLGSYVALQCASYTTKAAYLDLGAPGSNIVAPYRNVGGAGWTNDANYVSMSGTSMAAPHVAAAAALVHAIAPTASPAAVAQFLKDTAQRRGAPEVCVGSGVIDPVAAVRAAAPPAPPPPVTPPPPTPGTDPDPGPGPGDTPPAPGPPTLPTSAFRTFGPVRLLDTRTAGPALGAGEVRTVDVRSVPGLEQATAVAVSLTGVDRGRGGFLTAYGSGGERPTASSLNLGPGEVRTNALVVPVGADGKVAVYAQNPVDLVVDLSGVFVPAASSTSGRLHAVTPVRVLDTRTIARPFAPGETRTVDLRTAGLPADAVAAVISMTATGTRSGYWAAWRTGEVWGGTSTLNVAGDPTTISALVPVADGRIEVLSQTGGDLVVDVGGWFTGPSEPVGTSGLFVPQAPARLVDTRAASPLNPGGLLRFDNPGAAGAVAVNLTVVDPPQGTYLTVFEGAQDRPLASAANAAPGAVTATGVIAPASAQGWMLYSRERADVVVDATGYFLA